MWPASRSFQLPGLRRGAALLTRLLALLGAGPATALPDYWGRNVYRVEECDARVKAEGDSIESWSCYWRLGFEHADAAPAAMDALERVLAEHPRHPYAALNLGALIAKYRGGDRYEALYRLAQDEFHRTGNAVGEMVVGGSLVLSASWNNDAEMGWPEYERMLAVAEQLRDPDSVAYAHACAAELAYGVVDYGRAETLLRQAEAAITGAAPWWLAWRIADVRGRIYSATGRPLDALQAFDRAAALATNDPHTRALTIHAQAAEAVRLAYSGELPMDQAEARLDEAIAVARAQQVRVFMTRGELPSLMLQAAMRGSSAASEDVARTALARGRTNNQGFLITHSLRLLTRFAVERSPPDQRLAAEYAQQGLEAAWDTGHPAVIALAHLARAHVDWRLGAVEALRTHAEDTMDAVDQLRWSQPEETMRARTSAEWAFAYELLAGWLLDLAGTAPEGAALEPALATIERLRGRILLDELARSGIGAPIPPELESRRSRILAELAGAQRLLVGTAAAGRRAEAISKARAAEGQLVEIEEAIARTAPASVPAAAASMAAIQAGLTADEALLSYQLWRPDFSLKAPYAEGRSWLVVLTRSDAFAVRMPDSHQLEPRLTMFRALLAEGNPAEASAAEALERILIEPVLDRLGPGVRRLIVIPDGPLIGLPIEILRRPGGEPLAAQFTISTSPSASLWLRWRIAAGQRGPGAVLALADPTSNAPPGTQRDAAEWLEGLVLPALPHARAEARTLVEALPEGGALRLGPEASERFLKTSPLGRWGLLHFATHAVVDESHPARSALILAGDGEEDGLLQPREIAALDLTGKAVLLSACRSASGQVLAGEGALGLVRAFFRGGATAVVAAPWPIQDSEARGLISALADELHAGHPLGEALTRAKRTRMRAGASTLAWAGLQLHGDANFRPVVHPRPSSRRWTWLAVTAGVLVLASLALVRLRRAAAASRSRP